MRYSVRTRSTRHNAWESDVEPPLESPPDEVTRLRDALNELRGILARPALWTGGEPPRIVNAALDTLSGGIDGGNAMSTASALRRLPRR